MAAACNGGNNDADHLGLVATRAAEAADEAATPLSLPLPPAADVAGTAAPPTAAAAKAIARQDSTAAATAETALRASHVLGMGLVLLSTVCFSAMALFQSMVGDAVPSLVSTCVRFGLQGALTAVSIAALRHSRAGELVTWLGRPEKRWMLCRRGLWGVGGMSAYFYSLSQIPLSEATSLAFLNVPLTAVLAHWLCNEAYTVLDAATAAVAFAGVVVITQPAALFGGSDAKTIPPLLVAIILAGAVCSAMAYITVKQLGPGEDPLVVTLW
jgi:drug/metabolite transporter (DMT)-like permease